MTQCSFSGGRFRSPSGHEVRASFDGGDITSDAGVMLLRRADDAERLVERFSRCFRDHRDALRVEHSVADLVRQRVYGLALGYEDQSDHDTLRLDPLLAAMVGLRDTGIRCRTPPRRFSDRKYRSKAAFPASIFDARGHTVGGQATEGAHKLPSICAGRSPLRAEEAAPQVCGKPV
jgi:hypothetical protein